MKNKVAVLVGRFQVPYLHIGHIELIKNVVDINNRTILLLGTAHKTRNNPLDFETRKLMIQSRFPNIEIYPIADSKHHTTWTKNVDSLIDSLIEEEEDVVIMYGGRESFIPGYIETNGKFKTYITESNDVKKMYSGTNLREECSKKILNSDDYRIGIIAGQYQNYPVSFSTIDIIVEKMIDDKLHILLGQKPIDRDENLWVFPGGFIDKGDGTGRDAAKRELKEETSLDISSKMFKIFDQIEIADWRYKTTENSIFTTVYTVRITDTWQDYVVNNKAKAGDDLCDVKWVSVEEIEKYLSDIHSVIWESYKENKLETV